MSRAYAEIIADEISRAGWSYGHSAYQDTGTGKRVHVADAHKNGQRCVARGERLMTAYLELRSMAGRLDVACVFGQESPRRRQT